MALIMDDIQEIRKIMSQTGSDLKKFDGRSFAAKAKDSTFQFPCLISDSIAIDTATTLVNYLEPVYADIVQTALSQDNRINLGTTNVDQWLKKQHQNIKLESTNLIENTENDDLFGIFERAYDGNAILYMNDEKTMGILVQYTNEHASDLIESNRKQLTEYMTGFDLKPFPAFEAKKSNELTNSQLLSSYVDGKRGKAEREEDRLIRDMNLKNTNNIGVPRLLDRDVKKVNNMRPYGMEYKLVSINDNGDMTGYVSIIIGIKTILHLIRSDEMIINLGNTIRSKGKLMSLVRWTSGEISFMKDLLLHIDDIKFDVSNMSTGCSKWFPTLKRLKDRKMQFKSLSVQRLVPNATIVISSYELDEIENRYGINLKDTRFAKKIMDEYFLISFIIIDDATQTINVLNDGDSAFQTYALETLEREVNLNSNRLSKEIGRMISR